MAFHFMILLTSTTIMMPIATATQGKVSKPTTCPSTKTKRSAKSSSGSVRSSTEFMLEGRNHQHLLWIEAVWYLVPTIVFIMMQMFIVMVRIWSSRVSKDDADIPWRDDESNHFLQCLL